MAKVDTASDSGSSYSYGGPPGRNNILLRQLSSIALIVLLYSAAMPFTPLSWIVDIQGAFLFDRLGAGIVLFCACYFQWRISSLTSAMAVMIPGPGATVIRDGRIRQGQDVAFVWHPDNYWPYALCEAVLLCVAEFGPSEILRRSIVIGAIAGLWVLGWHATPQSTKTKAWEYIKGMLFWLVLDEVMAVRWRGGGRRRR